jgi:hypothetical protein
MLSPDDLFGPLRRVEADPGAPGVDGMTMAELRPWSGEHRAGVREALEADTYRPAADLPGGILAQTGPMLPHRTGLRDLSELGSVGPRSIQRQISDPPAPRAGQ